MGARVHGRRAYAYTILDSVPLGANVTIDILHRVIEATYDEDDDLPDILYLQLDNTTRQCKTQYVIASREGQPSTRFESHWIVHGSAATSICCCQSRQ